MDEETFEEAFSLKLSWMNVFLILSIMSIVLVFLTTYIIAFTSLKEYIPGYPSSDLRKNTRELMIKTDSLELSLRNQKRYYESIKAVIFDDTTLLNKKSLENFSVNTTPREVDVSELNPTERELMLKEELAKVDQNRSYWESKPKISYILHPPFQAKVHKAFSHNMPLEGVEFKVKNNIPIQSIADGVVLFSKWVPSQGHVIIIRHNEDLISVFRNLTTLIKKKGDVIKSAQALSLPDKDQPNDFRVIQFELWKNGYPIDPQLFLNFE